MNQYPDIEEFSALPFQIRQVRIRWRIPLEWQNAITRQGVNVFREVECFIAGGWGGRIGSLIVSESFGESFRHMEREHGEQVREAMEGKTVPIESVIFQELWRVIQEAAEIVEVTPQTLILVQVARVMKFQDELNHARAAMERETSQRRAKEAAAPRKVVSGPWT